MNNEPAAEKIYPVPKSLRIPQALEPPLRQMARWRGQKVAELINEAIRELIDNHYEEFKRRYEILNPDK